jgi:hypothetical protein
VKHHPITSQRQIYRGTNRSKRNKAANYNRVAATVEQHLRDEMERLEEADRVQVFISHTVAYAVGEDPELVRDIIYSLDAGANGVTLWKGDYERALANMTGR